MAALQHLVALTTLAGAVREIYGPAAVIEQAREEAERWNTANPDDPLVATVWPLRGIAALRSRAVL
jgi:hypothetical protein